MRKTALLSVLALSVPAAAQFSNKSFGDGGGYKHPDRNVGGFLEEAPRQGPAELKPRPDPIAAAKPVGGSAPARALPARPRPIPFSNGSAKADAPSRNDSSRPEEKSRDSSAFAAPGASTPAADEDSDAARRDYESRLLGAPSEAPRPRLGEALPEPAGAAPSEIPAEEGMLFISLELDAAESGSLRDAVAGLGAAASFRPDARFEPQASEGGVRISGWVPASRLGDAIARPGVRRVSVERGARPASESRLEGGYLVAVRVADPAKADEEIAESVRVLSSKAGFKLERVLGVETVPGGPATAMIYGRLPLSSLSRAMGLPGVVGLTASDAPAASGSEVPAAPEKKGFMAFVMGRALWLVLLTLLLALPTIGEAVRKGLCVFVPYR